ncbi:MAG: hypothetical protein GWN39_13565 [Thermoplasmata archaeon]|nr:hypothetical protein [Thermoplasmata archaeon]
MQARTSLSSIWELEPGPKNVDEISPPLPFSSTRAPNLRATPQAPPLPLAMPLIMVNAPRVMA